MSALTCSATGWRPLSTAPTNRPRLTRSALAHAFLLLLIPLPLLSCRSAGEQMSRGAFDELLSRQAELEARAKRVAEESGKAGASAAVGVLREEVVKLQAETKAYIIAKASASAAVPVADRTASDWFWILLGAGAGTTATGTALQRIFLGNRAAAAAKIAEQVAKLLTPPEGK